MNNSKGVLLIVSGPSGVGKGTIVEELLKRGPEQGVAPALSVSMTSREMRIGEQDGVSYYFVSRERFEQAINNDELLEYNCYSGNYYGTPRAMVEQRMAQGEDIILEIDINGGDQVKKRFPSVVRVFITPPSMSILEQRLRDRGTNAEDDIIRRLGEAQHELDRSSDYDYIIVNDDLDEAVDELISVIRKEKNKECAKPTARCATADKPVQQRGGAIMEKKTIDDVFKMCDSRYALVNLVAAKAREISEEADKHKESLLLKPVNIVLDNLKSGRSAIVKSSAPTNIYRDEDFEVNIAASEDAE